MTRKASLSIDALCRCATLLGTGYSMGMQEASELVLSIPAM